MAVLNRDDVDIYYEIHGSGPALLLTHGYSASSQMWLPQIEDLSEHHTLILWDMRGHGRSAAPEDPAAYSETLTTGDMAALLRHLGFEHAVVGGLSLGGYMSLAFYADYPEMVQALLVFDTGPGFKKDAAREGWNRTARERAEAYEQSLADDPGYRSPVEAAAARRTILGLSYAARYLLTQSTSRVIDSLPGIRVPTLVLAGAEDTPFLAATDYMAAKIPGARKVVIPEAGHTANLDQPVAFNRAVLEFLQAL
jgi:pimeloyl-ACP methyl ester carboxylesterase